MVNRTVIPSRKGELGAGCCINWKVQCSFVFLQTWDETQGESWLKARGNVRERFGRGWYATRFLLVWHWTPLSPLSSAKVSRPTGSAGTVLSDIPPCLQSGSLSPFWLNPLSIWFQGGRMETKTNFQTIGWSYFKRMWWFLWVCYFTRAYYVLG